MLVVIKTNYETILISRAIVSKLLFQLPLMPTLVSSSMMKN